MQDHFASGYLAIFIQVPTIGFVALTYVHGGDYEAIMICLSNGTYVENLK